MEGKKLTSHRIIIDCNFADIGIAQTYLNENGYIRVNAQSISDSVVRISADKDEPVETVIIG